MSLLIPSIPFGNSGKLLEKFNKNYSPPKTFKELKLRLLNTRFSKISYRRKKLWLCILYYIAGSEYKCADMTDLVFIEFIDNLFDISEMTLSRELKRVHD